MTTALSRPRTVTARIFPAPTAGNDYAVTVYVNREPHSTGGYHSGHIMTEARTADGAPLQLIFHAERFTDTDLDIDPRDVAEAALCIGNGHGEDDHGQAWPPTLPPLSVGDVVAVTSPYGTTEHLSIAPNGYTRIQTPAHLAPAETTDSTPSRHL
ncbi:hypothetical protein [Streptomyces lydicus]|uniref:hypothetical protein n=1 Tax=Streptomyces lydicus TaxID=47763 RepID=UPI0010114E34|nr:hypothetical protein [Streptomyces lydicus]MCZ1012338.1 hypothetical protein [Streptomyces lydicus]